MNCFAHHSCQGSTSVQPGWFSFLTSDSLIERSSLTTSKHSPSASTGTICNHGCVLPPTTFPVSFSHLWYKMESFSWSFSLQECMTAIISALSWHFRKPKMLHGYSSGSKQYFLQLLLTEKWHDYHSLQM